jgi:trehalose/maltose hydrolase-like predicted phosphorylase
MSEIEIERLVPRDTDQWNILFQPIGNAIVQNDIDDACDICPDSHPHVQTHCNQPGPVGAFLGNGKIGLVVSTDTIDVAKSMISTELTYQAGTYRPNVLEVFYVNKIKVLTMEESILETTMKNQSLDIKSGILNTQSVIKTIKTNKTNDVNVKQINIGQSLYCPRNLPFCIMQTLDILPFSGSSCTDDTMDVPIFHEVYCKDSLKDVVYNNNVINTGSINSMYVLNGTAVSMVGNKKVAFASCYLFENITNWENMGFNVYRHDPRKCYNTFMIKNAPIGTTFKLHILSAIMTDFDFDNPLEEVKRIVINATHMRYPTMLGSLAQSWALKIRADHIIQWNRIWQTTIAIKPKSIISLEMQLDIAAINQRISASLYNLYACMRENVNMEINALNLSFLDQEGFVMYDGDIWLTPLMLVLKPDIARSLLEYRYKTITMAQQISAGYGFNGSKYPYVNDTLGYKNALYYDITSPLHVFNNAMISINVWNYFRVTKDRDWLASKGYSIIKSIADFFVSTIDIDESGSYILRNTVGLNENTSEGNNSFTNNMVRMALRFAIEASYELSFPPKQAWHDCYFGLPIVYANPDTYNDIIKFDQDTSNTSPPHFSILEMLFVIIPSFSQLYFKKSCCSDGCATDTNSNAFNPDVTHGFESIKRNLDYYIDKINADFANHPYNVALLAIIYGIYAQHDPTYVDTYDLYLHRFIKENGTTNWCGFRSFNTDSDANSIIMNAIFLTIIIQGVNQISVTGGVAETRFYYEELKVKGLLSANMPTHWQSVKVASIGDAGGTSVNTVNMSLYVS